jgi:hypothetical protein
MYNQIGHFAAAGAALAKSLFLGGVTRRFPELRVALLEGGVAGLATLGAQLPAMFASDLGHWDVPDFDRPLAEA